jgi:hypothetical protein
MPRRNPKVKHKCKFCKNTFYEYLSNHRKYCSKDCSNKMQSKRMLLNHPRYWLGKNRSEEDKEKIRKNGNAKNKGKYHPAWKENTIVYSTLHGRLKRYKGKANKCDVCGEGRKNKRYEWANLTGNYSDINDYKKMCKSCHTLYDNKKRRENNESLYNGFLRRKRTDKTSAS